MRLDGKVTTGILGADAQWERWLAGVALSVSEGKGTFDQPGVDSGTVESTLTSVNPYVRCEASERLSAWGLLGYGTGDMTIRGNMVAHTDISMRLGAAGARGVLLEADEGGGIDLALRGDAFLVQMESVKAANTVATKADASRLRLVLEGGRSFALGEGAVLTPALELGLRHDGGDAETGTGVGFHAALEGAGTLERADVLAAVEDRLGGFLFGAGRERRRCPSCGRDTLALKLSRYGPFVGCGDYPACGYRRGLAAGAPGDGYAGPRDLGTDPGAGLGVTLRRGPNGWYVQRGERAGKDRPERMSLPPALDPDSVDLDLALRLLALPREVGRHPETGEPILAGIGRYGPWLRHGDTYAAIPAGEDVLAVGINRAVALIVDKEMRERHRGG